MDQEMMSINEHTLTSKIYTVRGQKVMLDFELAAIYGYETKTFNQQVKNNIDKFDEDFRFQLSKQEWQNLRSNFLTSSSAVAEDEKFMSGKDDESNLRCKNCTSNSKTGSEDDNNNLRSNFSTSNWGGTRYLPYVFTEQGIYMLMTVLKGELAVKQSKALIRTFKQMKDYILDNQGLIGQREFLQLSLQVTNNIVEMQGLKLSLRDVDDKVAEIVDTLATVVKQSDLSKVILDFSKPQVKKSYLVLNGQPVEANLAYTDIYSLAKKSIYVVDNYIGVKTLVLLKDIKDTVEVIIFSDNLGKGLHKLEYQDFVKEYPNIKIHFQKTGGIFHDRYIIIDWQTEDEKIFHCGASSKDAGGKITTVCELSERKLYQSLIAKLLQNPILNLR